MVLSQVAKIGRDHIFSQHDIRILFPYRRSEWSVILSMSLSMWSLLREGAFVYVSGIPNTQCSSYYTNHRLCKAPLFLPILWHTDLSTSKSPKRSVSEATSRRVRNSLWNSKMRAGFRGRLRPIKASGPGDGGSRGEQASIYSPKTSAWCCCWSH